MKQWLTIICIGFFLLIVGIFFYPTILSGKLPVPSDTLIGLYHPWRDLYASTNPRGVPFKNFLITDPVRQQIPWRKIAIDQWKEGNIPRWNPYNFSGTPLAANVQAAVFYPLNILFFFLDFPVAWTLLVIFEPLLAGVLFFSYLRHHELDPLACLLGAIAWSFSGFSIAWLTWGTMIHVAAWLPLVLLSIDKLIEAQKLHQNIIWLLVFVFGLAMQVFAGHIQIALYCIVVALGYAGYRIWQTGAKSRKNIVWVALGFGIFILVTAVQWLPMMKLVFESGRMVEGENWIHEGWFIPWQHVVQFVAPDFFGNPATLNYWGIWNYGELVGYIGIVPLLFVVVALLGKSKGGIYWKGVAIVALLFALPTPLAKLPYLMRLPILSSLQPTRLMVIIDFSLAMLAATGFDAWLRKKEGNRWGAIFVAGITCIVLWFVVLRGGENFQVSKRNIVLPSMLFITGSVLLLLPSLLKKYAKAHIVGIILVGITTFDLFRFGWKFTPFTPREYFFPETQIISFLKQQEKPFRVMSTDNRILPPNVSAYYGIETIEGYDPLLSQRYEELIAAIARGKPDITPPFGFNRIVTLESIDSPLLPMLNVRYILTLTGIERPFLKKVFQEGETRVYEYTRGFPRAFFVSNVRQASNKKEAINELFDTSFDPANVAIVEGLTDDEKNLKSLTKGTSRMISYSSGRVVMETETSGEGFLVVSESYSPEWKVEIDGAPREAIRTNYNFLSTLVPAGAHRVEFSL